MLGLEFQEIHERMRPDQERVRSLLTDTVTLLCKNGLQFTKELKVQGLLGITTDDNDVFVVHINETFGEVLTSASHSDAKEPVESKARNDLQHSIVRKRPLRDHPEQSGASAAKVKNTLMDDRPDLPLTSETDTYDIDTDTRVKVEIDDEYDVMLTGTSEVGYDAKNPNTGPGFLLGYSPSTKRTASVSTGAGRHSSQISEFDRTMVEKQFAVEPPDSGWAPQEGFGDGHQGPVTGVSCVLRDI